MFVSKQGFTIVELLVVMALMIIVAGFSLSAIASYAAHQEIERSVTTITSTLTETRQRTLSAESLSQFGVMFGTSSVAWFAEPYDQESAQLQNLPGVEVAYSFSHNEDSILFSRLRGETNATGTVMVSHPRSGRTIHITIEQSGRYTVEDVSAD